MTYSLFTLNEEDPDIEYALDYSSRLITQKSLSKINNSDGLTSFVNTLNSGTQKIVYLQDPYIIIKDLLHLRCLIGVRLHYCFADLNSKEGFIVKKIKNDLSGNLPFGKTVGSTPDYLVTYIEPSKILSQSNTNSRISEKYLEFDKWLLITKCHS